ncbi:MAG: hypothetical protein WD095_00445 [Candidatus Paceibacterota bacterium]
MKLLFFETYFETIKNSKDSTIFQSILAETDNKKIDILDKGKRSCGLHVSGILIWFNLIKGNHATVSGTIKDMEESGWVKINKPKPGCVIHWEEWSQGGTPSEHLGFYIGDEAAISNNWKTKTPQKHHWTYEDKRGIKSLYWHSKLENKYFND